MEDEILKSAQAILQNSPYRDLRNVRCLVVSGNLILVGTVRSFYHKQVAIEALKRKINGFPMRIDLLKVEDSKNT